MNTNINLKCPSQGFINQEIKCNLTYTAISNNPTIRLQVNGVDELITLKGYFIYLFNVKKKNWIT